MTFTVEFDFINYAMIHTFVCSGKIDQQQKSKILIEEKTKVHNTKSKRKPKIPKVKIIPCTPIIVQNVKISQ